MTPNNLVEAALRLVKTSNAHPGQANGGAPVIHGLPGADANAFIQGEIGGQIAIGNHTLQIGSIHGAVVHTLPAEAQTFPRARPTPVFLRPQPFLGLLLLDRGTEVSAAAAALGSAQHVEFYGPPGVGKTALLRYLAYHTLTRSFPDGVVYLSARRQPLADLIQSLFDAFYESDATFKPTGAQLRDALQGKHALVVLEDVDLTRDEAEILMDVAPGCAFLLSSTERHLWGERRALALRGLPPDEALVLMERELGRPLSAEERPAAQGLCARLEGHPLHILQAAALIQEQGGSLAALMRQIQEAGSPHEGLATQILASLSEREVRILAVLAAVEGAPLHCEHLSAVTGLENATPILEALGRRGLVQAYGPRYRLAGAQRKSEVRSRKSEVRGQKLARPGGRAGEGASDLQPLTSNLQPHPSSFAERLLTHLIGWAEGRQQTPQRLLEEAEALLQMLEWVTAAGRWSEALRLTRAIEGALAQGQRWGAWAWALQSGLQAARRSGDQAAEAWALHQWGTRALCLGDTPTARAALSQALRLREALGDQAGAAVTRHNLDALHIV